MARKSQGRKRYLSPWKMKLSSKYLYSKPPAKKRSHEKIKSPLQEKLAKKRMDLKLMRDKVRILRREIERDKKSLTEDKTQLKQLEIQLEQGWTGIRQERTANAIADVYVKAQLAIIDAEDAGDWVTANNLAHELRELMMCAFGLG